MSPRLSSRLVHWRIVIRLLDSGLFVQQCRSKTAISWSLLDYRKLRGRSLVVLSLLLRWRVGGLVVLLLR